MSYFRDQIEPSESATDAQKARPVSHGARLLRNYRLAQHAQALREAPVTDRDRALVLGCADCGRDTDRIGISGARQCSRCADASSRAALRSLRKGKA